MCPRCEEPMAAFEYEGVEIDRCVVCGGTWLDGGEIEMITELAGVDPGPITAAVYAAGKGKKSDRRCPRCRKHLREIRISGETPLDIDRCPYGHGLWFDPGEMEELVARFEDGEGGVVAKFFKELYREDLTDARTGETDE